MSPKTKHRMISKLDSGIIDNTKKIEKWIRGHLKQVGPAIYTSVDMRCAGYKISPIDTNLYPAGFNNLCTTYNKECVISFEKYISDHYEKVEKILVISETHTRNKFYIENLRCLLSMLETDGYETRAGMISQELMRQSVKVDGLQGSVEAFRIDRDGDILRAGDFVPDIVLSNNDFTEGVPEILKGIRQPIDPSPSLGWHMRRKSDHFVILEHMMDELGEILGIDPWLIYPLTVSVRDVDFHRRTGLEKIAAAIDLMIERLRAKHDEHEVEEEPFVFIKSNSGTYGMGVISADSGKKFLEMSSKNRKKMRKGKGGIEIGEVIVQEGVPTSDIHDGYPVEPVIYLVGGEPVGGFYRINRERTIRENLNSRGMTFSKICFHQLDKDEHLFLEACEASEGVMMRVFGTIARVCAIATGYEYRILIDE